MKIKGHIIAKVVLTVVLAMTLTLLGVMLKQVPESNVIKQHEKSLSMSTKTFFDRMDRWFELSSDKLYYALKPMSIFIIGVYSTMLSVIIVLLVDLTAGVGRSRFEERMEKRKSEV